MTKKHYIQIVQAIRESRVSQDQDLVSLAALMVRLCNTFKADNKAFDEDKFYAAVYAQEKKS